MREFFQVEPTAHASWRMAVLLGVNSRTYKFALGNALLSLAADERAEVPLVELAEVYARGILEHLSEGPQAPTGQMKDTDFLAIAAREAEESRRLGRPTEELVHAAIRSIPSMVMQKFHNQRGGVELPHRFYELTGTGKNRTIILTPALTHIARSEQANGLVEELDARWRIVETSFASGVGRSLLEEGLAVDWSELKLTDRRRRRSITGITAAVVGFQHGRCLICHQPLTPSDPVAVDHVFPYSYMQRLGGPTGWKGPDLDAVWNLAPTHDSCNATKSDRPPKPEELTRLALRNDTIMSSPVPLRRTLELTLKAAGYKGQPGEWSAFIHQVIDLVYC
ncbi:hypothetical protein [Actinocorallia aurantiaca]|uniref:HNH endonuclease n=1 Tax=Actinocorallia aurantiaca TaxID=46204 RepID=A0ABN3UHH9_9ACTN